MLKQLNQSGLFKNVRVEKVEEVLKVGDIVKVKVLDIDSRGKIKLSMILNN